MAAAGAAVVLVPGGASPAYAVSANDDGMVTVEISSLSDAAGLERELRAEGIPAVVRYLEPGMTCKVPWFTPASPPAKGAGERTAVRSGVRVTPDGHARFTLSRTLPADTTLVIATQGTGTGPTSIQVAMASGTVGPCQVVAAPADADAGPGLPPPSEGGTVHVEKRASGTDARFLAGRGGEGPAR